MNVTAAKQPYAVIVGLGRTGLSCARYLRARGWRLAVTDTRQKPPELAGLSKLDSQIPVSVGGLDVRLLDGGLSAWTAAALPLERGEAPAPAAGSAVADLRALCQAVGWGSGRARARCGAPTGARVAPR